MLGASQGGVVREGAHPAEPSLQLLPQLPSQLPVPGTEAATVAALCENLAGLSRGHVAGVDVTRALEQLLATEAPDGALPTAAALKLPLGT